MNGIEIAAGHVRLSIRHWLRFEMKQLLLSSLLLFALVGGTVSADESLTRIVDPTIQYRTMVNRAVEYLKIRGQAADGSFSSSAGIGPTALVVSALTSVGVPPEDATVAKAVTFLEGHIQADGGIYRPDSKHQNYDTCLAMVALAGVNKGGKYTQIVKKAESYVKGLQWDEGEGKDNSDSFYGGAGYGSSQRPDLSNTSFLIDALKSLGNGPEDEAIQKALQFVTRCQNLESPQNTTPQSTLINDGGFFYTPAGGGESKAGNEPNGGLRSYGSMTYAGLKSMIFAGVSKDDTRVKAAVEFLRKHYDLESNPGVGQQGLYYYYHTLAKSLDAFGAATFQDAKGTNHAWKLELQKKLAELQKSDGSWINDNARWMEGDPNLVCGYALLALSHCKPSAQK
jgi:squalene-hopene/tetraprenyl-beta-curcumene cyclase